MSTAITRDFATFSKHYLERTAKLVGNLGLGKETLSDIQFKLTFISGAHDPENFLQDRSKLVNELADKLNSKVFTELAPLFNFLNTCLTLKTKLEAIDPDTAPSTGAQLVDNAELKRTNLEFVDSLYKRVASLFMDAYNSFHYSPKNSLEEIISGSQANLNSDEQRNLITILSAKPN